jgi:hypothetical protein
MKKSLWRTTNGFKIIKRTAYQEKIMRQAHHGALVYKKGLTRLTDSILYEGLQNLKIGPFFEIILYIF